MAATARSSSPRRGVAATAFVAASWSAHECVRQGEGEGSIPAAEGLMATLLAGRFSVPTGLAWTGVQRSWPSLERPGPGGCTSAGCAVPCCTVCHWQVDGSIAPREGCARCAVSKVCDNSKDKLLPSTQLRGSPVSLFPSFPTASHPLVALSVARSRGQASEHCDLRARLRISIFRSGPRTRQALDCLAGRD